MESKLIMELSYKGRYYNGHASTPFTADISFGENGLQISYANEAGEYVWVNWNREAIKETDLSSSIVVLRYGEIFPYQQLEITDSTFIAEYRRIFKISTMQRWMHFRTPGMIALVILGFVLSVVLGYLFVLPFAADQVAQSFPRDYEVAMGEKIYESVLSSESIDTAKTEAINQFFHALHVQTEYPVKITVVKSSTVNAFALPGGGIVVYDAILKGMEKPEDLAALLSHEFSHVELKHATRNIFRNLAGYLFISVLFSDLNGIASVVVQNAENMRTLKYSRDLEHEADANGLKILQQNRLDPKGMIRLFEQLKKEDIPQISEILSTHPDLDARIDFIKSFQQEHPYTPKHNDSLQFYFQRIKGDTTSW
jgi:predicted Zn-dependent protease